MKDFEWYGEEFKREIDALVRKKLERLAKIYLRLLDRLFTAPKHGRVYGGEETVMFNAYDADTQSYSHVGFVANKGKRLGKGRRGAGVHRASAPGEAPAIDTAALRKSPTFEFTDDGQEVGIELGPSLESGRAEIAIALEIGTSTIAPRPAWRPAFDSLVQEAEKELSGNADR